eukprot:12418592-Ditylum_brightwellii.AAC.1
MGCKESIDLQAALDKFDGNIRGTHSRKSTTVKLLNCNGVLHKVDQDEVKISESSLQGDKDCLETLNQIYTDNGGEHWEEFLSPKDLRKFSALQSSAEFIDKMMRGERWMKHIDESLWEEIELRRKYEQFRTIFMFMTLQCIANNSNNDDEQHKFFRTYLSLPETDVGAYE